MGPRAYKFEDTENACAHRCASDERLGAWGSSSTALLGGARVADEVRIASGVLEGTMSTTPGVRMFLGVPFAAPPVGDLRWKAPQPVAKWSGVRKATAFANRCIQTNPFGDMIFRSPAESEDCLYLSIWTPAKSGAERLPVMFWIHGGGFASGASDEGRHEGASLAARGVVIVEINYRMAIFGFFAHPELAAELPRKSSGNYGLLDQIEALRWVRENIAAFGGNPNNVTIFGESAGSFSVSALMASARTKGLIHKAIGQSGAYFTSARRPAARSDAEAAGVKFAESIGAPSLAALRGKTPAELVKAVGRNTGQFWPIIDGDALTEDPWNTFAAGRQQPIPLLAGWNSAEIKSGPTTVANLQAQIKKQYPDDADAISARPTRRRPTPRRGGPPSRSRATTSSATTPGNGSKCTPPPANRRSTGISSIRSSRPRPAIPRRTIRARRTRPTSSTSSTRCRPASSPGDPPIDRWPT